MPRRRLVAGLGFYDAGKTLRSPSKYTWSNSKHVCFERIYTSKNYAKKKRENSNYLPRNKTTTSMRVVGKWNCFLREKRIPLGKELCPAVAVGFYRLQRVLLAVLVTCSRYKCSHRIRVIATKSGVYNFVIGTCKPA